MSSIRCATHRVVKATVVVVAMFGLSACDLFKAEAERTKGDLAALSKRAGMDGAIDAAASAYTTNVQPTVHGVTDAVGGLETVQQVGEMGSEAASTVQYYARPVISTGADIWASMPHSEHELQSVLIGYNNDFTEWLRGQFKGVKLPKNAKIGAGSLSTFSPAIAPHTATLSGAVHQHGAHPAISPRGPHHR